MLVSTVYTFNVYVLHIVAYTENERKAIGPCVWIEWIVLVIFVAIQIAVSALVLFFFLCSPHFFFVSSMDGMFVYFTR